MKIKRQLINIFNSIKVVRKARIKARKNTCIEVEGMMNFEEACSENLRLLSLSGTDVGIRYMGRFGGVKHNFVCVDRQALFDYLVKLEGCVISIRDRGQYHRIIKAAALSTFRNAIGHIDIYKHYVSALGITLFGHREAVRIHMPFEHEDFYRFERVNPAARKIMKDGTEKEVEVDVGGYKFYTFEKFYNYNLYNSLDGKKVDVVYTWVDGDDPDWKMKKEKYLPNVCKSESHSSASSDSRFKHINELMYSIRSIFMYTNFVRHIYIVTDRQVPDWLQQDDSVTIVDHAEIFPDKSVLPSFNSHAIESCLHRIASLSENFIYLNDDILFGRSVVLEQFFTKKMSPIINYSNHAFIPEGEATPDDLPVDSAAKNARKFFHEQYGEWITRKFKHVPCPVNKKQAEELERMLDCELNETRGKRFRTYLDFSFLTCAYYHFMAVQEKCGKGALRYGYVNVNSSVDLYRLRANLTKATSRRWDVCCINDVDGKGSLLTKRVARSVLNEIYPFSSHCEKDSFLISLK